MKVLKIFLLIALILICSSLIFSINHSKKEQGRYIEIEWDWDKKEKLNVKIENTPQANPYSFELIKDDRILLIAQANNAEKIQIEYLISGLDINAKFSNLVSQHFSKDERNASKANEIPLKRTVQVTDDLLPGGILTVTFKMKQQGSSEEETDIVKFKIKDEYPWFFASGGMIFTTAKNPAVAIIKTNNIVSVDPNDETKKEYEQKIVMKNNSNTLEPLQSVVSFFNFRIYKPIYVSLGFPLNENIFKEPMLGLSYYHKIKNVGLVGTAGLHFHKETEIDSRSGFEEGYIVDPSLGLTADEIPTEEKYRAKFFFGFSFRF